MRSLAPLTLVALAALTGCAKGYTYNADVQPLLAAHCESCHESGGIAFPLQTYAQAFANRAAIATDVQSLRMPPWLPDDTCNSYKADPSLSAQEIAVLAAWAAYPSEGDPKILPVKITQPTSLGRVDLSLPMAQAYAPRAEPDDYECFLLDWPETATTYVTGFSIVPGNPRLVHNASAYIASPGQLSSYTRQLEQLPDGGTLPRYPCFGGPTSGLDALVNWLGLWVPGIASGELPQGTGIQVQPGSKVVLQINYTPGNDPGATDLSTVQLELSSTVAKQGALLPFANPSWVLGGNTGVSDAGSSLFIPAGQASYNVQFQLDPTPYLGLLTNNIIPAGTPITVYSAVGRMLLHGTQEQLSVIHPDQSETCLLNLKQWDFGWQGNYFFRAPIQVVPGDQLAISCTYDNSAANQPMVDGGLLTPAVLSWGESVTDELCLGLCYVTL